MHCMLNRHTFTSPSNKLGILIEPETNKQQTKQKQKTKKQNKNKNKQNKQTNKTALHRPTLTFCLTKGGYHPFGNFSLSPQNQKESELSHLANLGKFLILAYISLEIGYFELGHGYDIPVTSHLGHWYLFQYVWKEETPSYTMVEVTCIGRFHFLSSQWEVNHPWAPLGRRVTKKGLVRRGFSQRNTIYIKLKKKKKKICFCLI